MALGNANPVRLAPQIIFSNTSLNCHLFELYPKNYLKFGDNSFLLPSHSDLIFLSSYGKSLSTGEKMILILDEIKNDVETNLLLLDEWDANLDHSNIENISQKINVIAKNICVIEVRHRE